jgi:hypothetical protein
MMPVKFPGRHRGDGATWHIMNGTGDLATLAKGHLV